MMKMTVTCEYCNIVEDTTYNGEHHLPPDGWMQMYDPNRATTLDMHICPGCMPEVKAEYTKEKKKRGR